MTKAAELEEPAQEISLPPPCFDFLDGLEDIPYATNARAALRTGMPVVLARACEGWPAAELWTWKFLASRFGNADVMVGGDGTRRTQRLRKLLGQWWPEEKVAAPGSAVGCHRWHAMDEFPELRKHVQFSLPGITELGALTGGSQQASGAGRWSPARTALTMGQAGYVARPLRQVSFARHCWLACVRGAIRCLVVPSLGQELEAESCEAQWDDEDAKGRRSWGLDPLRPDLDRFPEAQNAGGRVCTLKEGEILVVPSGCLLWTEHLWSSLAVHHAFVTNENLMQFQQWTLHHRMNSQ